MHTGTVNKPVDCTVDTTQCAAAASVEFDIVCTTQCALTLCTMHSAMLCGVHWSEMSAHCVQLAAKEKEKEKLKKKR